MTKRVLFVCLGNICRSPMAEGICKDLVSKRSDNADWNIDSAGTGSWHVGNGPDERSAACCKKHDVILDHRARQFNSDDFENFDYIFCMDRSNLDTIELVDGFNDSPASISLLGAYDPDGELEVGDPYYGSRDGFEHNFQHITRCVTAFLKDIR